MLPAFAGIVLLIKLGLYRSWLKYLNIFLQVTLVSAAIVFDGMNQGANYALSSMPPMAYALVPTVTAFRLQPSLGLFAGGISALQFLVLYLYFLQPDAALIAAVPSLSFEVTMMKVVILCSLGIASAFAARTLKRYFEDFGKAQDMQVRLERSFGRFVSAEIVNQIRASADGIIPPGQQQVAIVFGDIRGFTRFASMTNSVEVTRVLNEFFEIVCRVIEEEGGMVNKFLGDGYLALFGVYSNNLAACDAAARAVLKIQQEVAPLLTPLGLSAGAAANYGQVITGEIGSKGRCEFTAIGEPVNLASRVEGFNAQLGTRFLATTTFVQQLHPDTCVVTSRGGHEVKGLDGETTIYELTPAHLQTNI
jgi:adenylate cyclase